MRVTSSLPRKQRKALYTAHHALRRRRLSISLSRELRSKYSRRRLPVKKGDTVRVMSGSFVGREERVTKVDYRGYKLVLDNIVVKKADGKMKKLPISPHHLMITKLDLADPWRRRILKAPAEEAAAAPEPSGDDLDIDEPETAETGGESGSEEEK